MQKIDKIELLNIVDQSDFIIIDRKVKDLYFETSFKATTYIVDDPERSKNLKVFEDIVTLILNHSIKRNSKILAIGGGATSDLAGFVASTILRGIGWDVIPTTLLSMIDASIGGKVGINTKSGKNLIGNFHVPDNIYFYLPFLDTLSKREQDSGMGELLKYCFLSENIFNNLSCDLNTLILMCAKYKYDLTLKDPKESNERVYLNLGHTFGHAFETITGLPHGTCVAIGIRLLFILFDQSMLTKFDKITETLNIQLPEISIDLTRAIELMKLDKKNKNDDIHFVLIDKLIAISADDLIKRVNESNDARKYFN